MTVPAACIHELSPASCSVCSGRGRDDTPYAHNAHTRPAVYRSRCPACDTEISPGDDISPDGDGGWKHAGC